MAPPRRRYFTEDDLEIGVTRTQLRRMPREEQLRYMIYWFREYFEDPANQTPYNSDEGGYLYIWGGPYDANDQIGGEFGGFVPDDVIEEAIREAGAVGKASSANGSAAVSYDENAVDLQKIREAIEENGYSVKN